MQPDDETKSHGRTINGLEYLAARGSTDASRGVVTAARMLLISRLARQ